MRSLALTALPLFLLATLSACDEGAPPSVLVTKAVEYKDGDVVLEGWLAYDPKGTGKRPGVLVVHEWWGLGAHAKRKAEALARLGYVAFAVDMYGKGRLTQDPAEAGKWASQFRGEGKAAGRRRVKAGLDVLVAQPNVDPARIGAIGFCFGGTVVLELAWSGADVKGVVCFHGQPTTPDPAEAAGVKSAVLVCHGADDGFVPDQALADFQKAMKAAKLDWNLVYYAGAVHSFTNPDAGKAGIPGVAYDARADRRSWEHMRSFFADVLGG
jgi:dienelactone hydrolase